MQRGATLDTTGFYRYSLWREWNSCASRVGFVMLNPSRADEFIDDPTIRRCMGFAQTWGFGSLEVVNLFAYRTAHPRELNRVTDPVGEGNDEYLASLGTRVERVILAWGNWGSLQNRSETVMKLLSNQSKIYCLGTTKLGHPKHPLYISKNVTPTAFFS